LKTKEALRDEAARPPATGEHPILLPDRRGARGDRFIRRIREWLWGPTAPFGRMMVALALNVPLLLLALSRYPSALNWASLGGIYAGLVFLGYYVSILFVVLTCLFLVTNAWRRLFLGISAATIGLALFYLAVDGLVYRLFRSHVDGFWLQYMITTFEGVGTNTFHVAGAVVLLLGIGALEWVLFRVAGMVRARRRWGIALVTACVFALVLSQALHVAAYEANDARITALTPELPFYFPTTSHKNAVRYGDRLSMVRELEGGGSDETQASLHYPRADVACGPTDVRRRRNVLILLLESWRADAMDSVVTPRMYTFAKTASVFGHHFSSGNATPTGVFPLFYGIHSTYWSAVRANNASIHNPVLIDAFQENGYAFGIFAESHFERHKIKDAVFRGITVQESLRGSTVPERDRDLTRRLLAFVKAQKQTGRSFFGFAFYKSSHFPYDYPADAAVFQPVRELSVVRAEGREEPTPVHNDYRNAVRYVDGLIGGLLDEMQLAGILDSTIVVITGDHGEEFNDTGNDTWGHTGNFTQFQTRVPLIVHAPGKSHRQIAAVTSHVDIAPTLLQEALGCGWNSADYSNGLNLFTSLPPLRPVIVSSYATHALILGEDVFVTWPLHIQQYSLDGVSRPAAVPSASSLRDALNEMVLFRREPRPSSTR
jgi:membrane-anchored protein YejM (alkaline phosphatase superfamily)